MISSAKIDQPILASSWQHGLLAWRVLASMEEPLCTWPDWTFAQCTLCPPVNTGLPETNFESCWHRCRGRGVKDVVIGRAEEMGMAHEEVETTMAAECAGVN